jgi:predicted nucleic acid-binding protein
MQFFDANVLLEVLLERSKADSAARALEAAANNAAISALTAHLVVYFGSKLVEPMVLQNFLAEFTILPLTQADFAWAFENNHNHNNDFEDALQVAVALHGTCEVFVTLDKKPFDAYRQAGALEVRLI